jgi:uncharacterized repeat protein (TIGR03803 family)
MRPINNPLFISRLAVLSLTMLIPSLLLAASSAQPATFTVLHNFTGGLDGYQPLQGLTIDGEGNLYGTAGPQAAFRLVHDSSGWVLVPIYQFTIPWLPAPYGQYPSGEMTVGADGSLYGGTSYGGPSCNDNGGCGSVFHLHPSASACNSGLCYWAENDIHDFYPEVSSIGPSGRFALDSAGNLYGTTSYDGVDGSGDIYELSPNGTSWNYTVLYSFTGGSDGGGLASGLIKDSLGNLYGSASQGGDGYGTIFELSPAGNSWVESTVYTFTGASDGQYPYGGLSIDSAGNLFGSTFEGGDNGGGTVFELKPFAGGWQFTVLYSFTGYPGGGTGPNGSLAIDTAGNLYGSTTYQGDQGLGSVFELSPTATNIWSYRQLHSFAGPDGWSPQGSTVLGLDGNVYGTARYGGANDGGYCSSGCGTIWKVTP